MGDHALMKGGHGPTKYMYMYMYNHVVTYIHVCMCIGYLCKLHQMMVRSRSICRTRLDTLCCVCVCVCVSVCIAETMAESDYMSVYIFTHVICVYMYKTVSLVTSLVYS